MNTPLITPSMEEDERLMRRECPPEFRETLERWLAACRAELLRQEGGTKQ